jgi:hypothetical protein
MRLRLLLLVGMSMGALAWAQTDKEEQASFFPVKERMLGISDFWLGWQGMVQDHAPLYDYLRLGFKAAYSVRAGWTIGGGMATVIRYPNWPIGQQVLRWTLLTLSSRYYLLHRKEWCPYVEVAATYAAPRHESMPADTSQGMVLLPQVGLAYRINETWSVEFGAQLSIFDSGGLLPYEAITTRALRPKGSLTIHW